MSDNKTTNLKNWIRNWYEGTFVPYDNDQSSNLFFIGGDQEFHWTARAARLMAAFWLSHWKWIITTVVAVVIAVLKFK